MAETMTIAGRHAVVRYDDEIGMYRGEFVGLNGGADFYSDTIEGLQREAEISLTWYLRMCHEDSVPE